MVEQRTPRQTLSALRSKLVEARRATAEQALATSDGNALVSLAKDLKDLQEEIEAIDRAAADEAAGEPRSVGFTGR